MPFNAERLEEPRRFFHAKKEEKMQTFSDIIKSRAQPVEKKGRFKVQKVDEDKRLVFGWANVSVDVGGN